MVQGEPARWAVDRHHVLVEFGQSALAQGYALPDVIDWLERIREHGNRVSFLGPRSPQGQALLEYLEALDRDALLDD